MFGIKKYLINHIKRKDAPTNIFIATEVSVAAMYVISCRTDKGLVGHCFLNKSGIFILYSNSCTFGCVAILKDWNFWCIKIITVILLSVTANLGQYIYNAV